MRLYLKYEKSLKIKRRNISTSSVFFFTLYMIIKQSKKNMIKSPLICPRRKGCELPRSKNARLRFVILRSSSSSLRSQRKLQPGPRILMPIPNSSKKREKLRRRSASIPYPNIHSLNPVDIR